MPPSSIAIAIDATYTRQSSGGIPRYGRELVRALRAAPRVEVIELGAGPFERRGSLRRMALTAGLQLAWYPWLGRRRARAAGADVMHCLLPRGPVSPGKPPLVVTVHDLVPFRFPESMTRWGRLYARATHKPVLLAADRIIVPSADTANDVVRLLGIPEERIRIVPMGVDARFFEPPAPGAERAGDPYVLFVGCPNPRKNLERLECAVGKLRARGFPHRLMLVGEDSWGRVDVGESFVTRRGKVSDEELRLIYAQADCLAIPSLHEGFGFPAIEAMAVGTPVVASREGSLPEVTGDAAVLVDAYDTDDITDGLERAITGGGALREKGKQRAAGFTWQRTAEMTLAVYHELL